MLGASVFPGATGDIPNYLEHIDCIYASFVTFTRGMKMLAYHLQYSTVAISGRGA